jgi:hypothetical protein
MNTQVSDCLAALARSDGLEISAHCAPHVHAHAAAAVPNLRHIGRSHDHASIELLLFEGEGETGPARWGRAPRESGAPGHGLTLRPSGIERYRVR